jgi:uncharacterized protein YbjT (DUF2867 family)
MRIAITGGTGFVGRHLARALSASGHEAVLIARGVDQRDTSALKLPNVCFFPADLSSVSELALAFAGCGGVAHCAGINRETGRQTYEHVHIEGTRNVVEAARMAGVSKVSLLSFLRARPNCGSGYHESKWAAEEIVRGSGLDYTILKAGVIYGRGDHMLDHLSHALYTFPVFATVGFSDKLVRPLAVEDLVTILEASLIGNRLSHETLAVMGPEAIALGEAARRVGEAIGRRIAIVPAPIWVHYALAAVLEAVMTIPLVSRAQVRILSEGVVEASPACAELPADLLPATRFSVEPIRSGLPEAGSFGANDWKCCA